MGSRLGCIGAVSDERRADAVLTERGEVAMALGYAAALNREFPSHVVPDTPENRALWEKIKAETAEIVAAGQMPDIPWDYALEPGELSGTQVDDQAADDA